MSFAGLRSARQAKESKSLVNDTPLANSSNIQNEPIASSVPGDAANTPSDPSEPPTVVSDCPLSFPAWLDVRKSVFNGRGLYSKENFSPGELASASLQWYSHPRRALGAILLSVRPHISTLSTPSLDSYCSYCSGPAENTVLRRCTGCRTVRYCDSVRSVMLTVSRSANDNMQACQNKDWSLHKLECQALQQWASSAPSPDVEIPSDAVRCLGRILWNMAKKGLDSTWVRISCILIQNYWD